jgi:hypothetical protein
MQIAAAARKGPVDVIVAPALLAMHYALKVMSQRTAFLGKETILATVSSSGRDEQPGRRIHRYAASESLLR